MTLAPSLTLAVNSLHKLKFISRWSAFRRKKSLFLIGREGTHVLLGVCHGPGTMLGCKDAETLSVANGGEWYSPGKHSS